MFARGCTRWAIVAVIALATAVPVAAGGATTTRAGVVPTKLLGVWHKTMTSADWNRAGLYRDVGVWTFVVKKVGTVTIYKPGAYQPGCSACADFTTTFRPNGSHLTLGSVPVCSFSGVYSWRLTGRTLILTPTADKKCIVRATFLGGRWKR